MTTHVFATQLTKEMRDAELRDDEVHLRDWDTLKSDRGIDQEVELLIRTCARVVTTPAPSLMNGTMRDVPLLVVEGRAITARPMSEEAVRKGV